MPPENNAWQANQEFCIYDPINTWNLYSYQDKCLYNMIWYMAIWFLPLASGCFLWMLTAIFGKIGSLQCPTWFKKWILWLIFLYYQKTREMILMDHWTRDMILMDHWIRGMILIFMDHWTIASVVLKILSMTQIYWIISSLCILLLITNDIHHEHYGKISIVSFAEKSSLTNFLACLMFLELGEKSRQFQVVLFSSFVDQDSKLTCHYLKCFAKGRLSSYWIKILITAKTISLTDIHTLRLWDVV